MTKFRRPQRDPYQSANPQQQHHTFECILHPSEEKALLICPVCTKSLEITINEFRTPGVVEDLIAHHCVADHDAIEASFTCQTTIQ